MNKIFIKTTLKRNKTIIRKIYFAIVINTQLKNLLKLIFRSEVIMKCEIYFFRGMNFYAKFA